MSALIRLAESGRLPDPLIRLGIRAMLRRRLRAPGRHAPAPEHPVAVATDEANAQHYELPPRLFELMLGPRLKYSSCLWSPTAQSLAAAENAMLDETCKRAGLADGMSVLDLGCGWGSLSLWIAERYPACRVTALSNSRSQADWIHRRADALGLRPPRVITEDINAFDPREPFDRVISIEMFEHVRNHAELLGRIARWLAPGGKLLVHHFCHRELSYPFEDEGDGDWMARHFFTGGMMPSLDLLESFSEAMTVRRRWVVDGRHYERTLRAWLERWDHHRAEALPVLAEHYGEADARLWFVRWRLFLLACAELFGYRGGAEWMVAHVLMEPAYGSEASLPGS